MTSAASTNPRTMVPTARDPVRTLIAFGGSRLDNAIATDFVAISKALIDNGLNPTCLSGNHLRDVMAIIGSPLVFGREDMGSRAGVYTHQEAQTPFYHLAGANGLENDILTWINNAAINMRTGDRLILILLGHGHGKTGDIILSSQGRTEFLTKSETVVALKRLPRNVRVTVMNETCYSGSWADVSSNVGDAGRRDVLAENACQHDQLSRNYYSSSGKFRCSLFAVAWLKEITTNAEARVSQHISRIMEEMDFVPPHQDTNTPVITTSSRFWRSYNTSHFILSPNLARAIINTASETHEDQLRAQSRARQLWKSLWSSNTRAVQAIIPGAANSGSSDSVDLDLALVNEYLDDLGTEAQAQGKSGLANVCLSVLEGTAPDNVKGLVVKMILWQEEQMLKAHELLQHLIGQNLISRYFDDQAAKTHLIGFQEDIQKMTTMFRTVPELFNDMQTPNPDDGYVSVIYQDAFQYFVHVLTCNKLLAPRTFDAKAIRSECSAFLRAL